MPENCEACGPKLAPPIGRGLRDRETSLRRTAGMPRGEPSRAAQSKDRKQAPAIEVPSHGSLPLGSRVIAQ